ncbi:MAG: LysM peptidoglycan-binding domain-containing protein [Burkholderiales bacterium]|nr:LysM peptidoglycan-binding domain-containing protein [Burkholderiales bacterium]
MHLPSRLSEKPVRRLSLAAIIALALAAGPLMADELKLQDNAPERYVVVKGDTLWGISGKFLKDPWKWPQIWNMNKEEIENPHWIYPGDVIVLDRSGGEPRLRLLGNAANDAARAKVLAAGPHVRVTPLEDSASPAIPRELIEPLLAEPLVVDAADFTKAPRVAQLPDERVTATLKDKFYAVGVAGAPGDDWQVFEGGKEIHDPDTKELLGYEVTYAGDASTQIVADVSTLVVTKTTREVTIGDRLIPKFRHVFTNYVPHVPHTGIEGKVLSTYGGVGDAGAYTTVLINRGEREGLHPGHVLFSYKAPRAVLTEAGKPDKVLKAPAEKSGTIYIYRVFPKLAYGLVVESSQPIVRLDEVHTP